VKLDEEAVLLCLELRDIHIKHIFAGNYYLVLSLIKRFNFLQITLKEVFVMQNKWSKFVLQLFLH
jgi:hypothetical protein